MKNYINKSAKRILSLALALVMLAGCLFTANVGVGIKAAAETENTDPYAGLNIQYWDGTYLSDFTSFDTEDVDEDGVEEYIIKNGAQLHYACAGTRERTAWLSPNGSSVGKEFVIDPTIDAFIMQDEDVVNKIGKAAFIEASSAEETRELFEDKFAAISATPNNWIKDSNSYIFAGDFDGSGVPIYGVFADADAKNCTQAGFFPAINGGGTSDSDTSYTDITLENIVIKNSYFKSNWRIGILVGHSWGDHDNAAMVDSCVFANCYLLGQNYNSVTASFRYTEMNVGTNGVLSGSTDMMPIKLSNTLVYGNETEYDTYTDSDSDGTYEVTTTKDAFNWIFRNNTNNGVAYGSITDSIILDAVVNNLQADSTDYCSNVYTDTPTTYTNVTNIIDNESVKGAH
ncbi:MAG: hypothetical protein IJZ21_03155, partial [Clostridia bacterium]|nr:hypothetical protein [Clostridia bacterium]